MQAHFLAKLKDALKAGQEVTSEQHCFDFNLNPLSG